MKDLRLKVSQTELKGLYNLTEMYIAGFQAADNEVAYLHSVMLMDYLEYLKKKLIENERLQCDDAHHKLWNKKIIQKNQLKIAI